MINKFVDIVSRPATFVCVLLIAATCTVLQLWFDFSDLFNLGISLFTMITGQAILVSGRRQEIAIHLKFDSIIKALDMRNDAIGAEHREEEQLKQEKEQIENGNEQS